jgi:hypothetical protein
MHGRLLHHGGTTGRQLWVVILVALGLALGSQAAAATECARATPLPADVHLVGLCRKFCSGGRERAVAPGCGED